MVFLFVTAHRFCCLHSRPPQGRGSVRGEPLTGSPSRVRSPARRRPILRSKIAAPKKERHTFMCLSFLGAGDEARLATGIPRMAEPFAGALPDLLIQRASRRSRQRVFSDTARKGECEGGTFDGFPLSRSIARPQATTFAQQKRCSKKERHPCRCLSFLERATRLDSLPASHEWQSHSWEPCRTS